VCANCFHGRHPVGVSAVSAGSAVGPSVGVNICRRPPHEGTIGGESYFCSGRVFVVNRLINFAF